VTRHASGLRTTSGGSPFRRREIALSDGSALVLHRDGSIAHVGPDRGIVASWHLADPDWERHALRFGITRATTTVAPRPRGAEAVGKIRP
jgi:hypothetical protein